MRKSALACAFAPLVIVLTGCPGDDTAEHPYTDEPPRAAESPPLERDTESIRLVAVGQPGMPAIVGSVTLTALTADETEVSIFLEDGPAGETLPVAIYREGCGIGAPSVWPLGQIAIDPDGQGLHTETVPEPIRVLREGDFYIQIRDEEGEPLACGPPAGEREGERPSRTPAGEQRGGDPFPPPADREEMHEGD